MSAGSLHKVLLEKNMTLAVAESCTGGLIGYTVTGKSGCSAYFLGGIIAYSNRIKIEQLNVTQESLDLYGAVSDVVARQMADGVRKKFGADIAVSVTGIAGPGGGTAEKPVGTVFIAVAKSDDIRVERFIFFGNRREIQRQTAATALQMVEENVC